MISNIKIVPGTQVFVVMLIVGILIFATMMSIAIFDVERHAKSSKDYDACRQVGGSAEQCTQIVYPDRWKESKDRRERMRNKLKSY